MVTTIKITCDGVFIQSNPFFTNSHLRSATSEAASNIDHNKLVPARNREIRTNILKGTVAEDNGNLTVVIRNNRRKINKTMLRDVHIEDKDDGLDESLYNLVEPRGKIVAEKCSDQSDTLMGQSVAQICRPPYHYMYMVRKVSSTRTPIRSDVTAANPTPTRSTAEEHCNGFAVAMMDGNRSQAVANSTAVAYDNGVRVTMMSLEAADYNGGVSDLVRRRSASPNDIQSELPPSSADAPAVDVDVIAVGGGDSEAELGHETSLKTSPPGLQQSLIRVLDKEEGPLRYSNWRKENLVSSADFENWYLKKKVERCVSSDCQPSDFEWTNNAAPEWLKSSIEDDDDAQSLNESWRRKPSHRNSVETSSSTTKRARRNSTGQIAGQLLFSRAASGGMNLQSTGHTAAVGKGYLQSSAHPPNSLSGECPWFLQNPAAALNNPPPTAPLRQHKRPAPQPGGQPQFSHPAHNFVGSNQNQTNTSAPHHLLGSGGLSHSHATATLPNTIAIQQHTYQSTTQQSPRSPIEVQCASGMAGMGGGTNSASLIGGYLPPSTGGLMSTSLNSAHLSNHGLQTQAIASNLSPASSSQSSLHNHSPGGSLLGAGTIHSNAAMSTSLHGLGGGAAGGHSPANNTNLSSLGVNNNSSNSGLSSSNSGVGPNLYIENGPMCGSAWPSGNSSLSPTTQQQHGAALGAPPPLLQRKCEVKLNAMPWFHGSISRDEAEHLLQPREDGLFLVRESTNFPGDYTLCVCFQGKVEHYRVKYLENKLTIDDEEYFENLGQLVQHYEKDADGLCTQLIKSLPKKGRQDFCINSKDFLDRGWVIPEADLQLRESIGKGEFGDVMLGILRSERVAVKVLKDEGAAQKFLTEASVMTTLEHENLVKFIGLVFSSKHIYLVTEFMSKGSLVDYLRSRGRQHITKKDQINFACDTCSGMEYLEAKKVVHRDLAARNVLIAENCIAKVADFGLAREECYNLDVGKLPIKWTAPEALKGGRFSNKSDMWSFGILLWEIYSFGRVPYPRIPLADVVKHVEVGYKMEAPEGCPPEIYEMMRQAWDLNPSRRPTFSELKVKLLQLKSITT